MHVLVVHTSHSIITQSCQTITSLVIKPKQARQSGQTLLRAIKGSPAPPPSIPANRSATLWHTDIIAAERKQTRLLCPRTTGMTGDRSAGQVGRGRRRGTGTGALCVARAAVRCARHVIPTVNKSRKMEPR